MYPELLDFSKGRGYLPDTPQRPSTRTLTGLSKCALCSHPLPEKTTGTPRSFCEDCVNFRKFYNAMLKALESIAPRLDVEKAKVIRGDLIAAANALPINRYNERGKDGKFR